MKTGFLKDGSWSSLLIGLTIVGMLCFQKLIQNALLMILTYLPEDIKATLFILQVRRYLVYLLRQSED